jgi:hypothetical protein
MQAIWTAFDILGMEKKVVVDFQPVQVARGLGLTQDD